MVLTADDLFANVPVKGQVVIFDDEHYYMGGVLAEKLRIEGHEVSLVTPAPDISNWTHNTMEQRRIQKKLLQIGIKLFPQHNLNSVQKGVVELTCVFTDNKTHLDCDSLVLVTERIPNDEIYQNLQNEISEFPKLRIKTFQRIGDCLAPGIIANAVHSGHLAAREFENVNTEEVPFLRERVKI